MISQGNEDERAGRYAEQARDAARAQVAQQAVAQDAAPGWYPDAHDAAKLRRYDGTPWTGFTQPRT